GESRSSLSADSSAGATNAIQLVPSPSPARKDEAVVRTNPPPPERVVVFGSPGSSTDLIGLDDAFGDPLFPNAPTRHTITPPQQALVRRLVRRLSPPQRRRPPVRRPRAWPPRCRAAAITAGLFCWAAAIRCSCST